jgi:glycosyl transferase family 87
MLTRTDFAAPYSRPAPIPYPYPVPTVYAFLIFVRLFPNPLAAYLIFVIVAFVIATGYLSLRVKGLARKLLPVMAVWATLLCAYPLLLLLDRANIEAFIWVLVLLGLAAFARNQPMIAAILWAIAASMKVFPALLFVLFLARRRYGIFAAAIGLTALFMILALAGVGPSIHQAAADSRQNAPFLLHGYILARNAPQFDHALFAAIKQVEQVGLSISGRGAQTYQLFRATLRIYNVLIPLGFVLLYWFRLRKLPQLNQFMAYMVLAILLPYVSNEYTLIYVYLVWAAFLLFLLADVAQNRVSLPPAAINTIMVSCAVLSVPLTYFGIPTRHGQLIVIGGQIKTVFLILILIAAIRFPMPSSLFGDLPSSSASPRS